MQPRKHSEDHSKHATDSEDGQPALEAPEALDHTDRSPEAPEALDYADRSPEVLEVSDERSSEALYTCKTRLRRARGLVGPETAGLPTSTEYFRVGSSTWICPTSFVSTRIGVELVDGLGN